MGIEKKSYSFRLHQDIIDQIQQQATAENRSLSNMVETILLQYLREKDSTSKS